MSSVQPTQLHSPTFFHKAYVSATLIRDEEDKTLEKLKELVPTDHDQHQKFCEAIDGKNFQIIFQIITHKDKEKSLNLPFFSRIGLKRTMSQLKRMNFDPKFCFVKDCRSQCFLSDIHQRG